MSIQKLINETNCNSDVADFESVQWLINADDIDSAVAKIDLMDTEPREQIVLAIADELGNGYVETVLGYGVT